MKNFFGGTMFFFGIGLLVAALEDYPSISDIPFWTTILIFVLISSGAEMVIKGFVDDAKRESKKEFDNQIDELTQKIDTATNNKVQHSNIVKEDTRSKDDLYNEAYMLVMSEGGTTLGNIKFKVNVDWQQALELLDILKQKGIIGSMNKTTKFYKVMNKK